MISSQRAFRSWGRGLQAVLLALVASVILGQGAALADGLRPAATEQRARLVETFGRSPLHFEPNQGQTAESVKFLARAPGYQLLLTPNEAVLAVRARAVDQAPSLVRMQLMGADVNPQPVLEALEALTGRSHYYLGNDPQRWQTDIPHFAKVRYSQVYPGVDWVLYGNPRQLEYDFVVAPGADPKQIAVSFAGADQARIAANGELVVSVAGREVLHSSPTIYQVVNGERQIVTGRYVLREAVGDAPLVGFEIAAYDRQWPLVIDPVVYFTFVGGAPDDSTGVGGDDLGLSIAVDSSGNAYITGSTSTNNANVAAATKQFPTTSLAINKIFSGGTDVFVTRMDATGTIIYSTYLGGSAFDAGYGIAVDGGSNAYVTGYTNSSDFPIRTTATLVDEGTTVRITGSPLSSATPGTAYTTTFAATGGQCTAVAPATCTVTYTWSLDSTTLANLPASLTLDPASGVLSGTPTNADVGTYNFIVKVADNNSTPNTARRTFRLTVVGSLLQGTQDAFVAKINASGTLGYSTYLGGTGNEAGYGIAVNTLGEAYVTGYTSSNDSTTPANNFPGANFSAITPKAAVGEDAFIVKVNAAGNGLVYSSLTGFAGNDRGQGIVLDSAGTSAYITGFSTTGSNEAAFISKVSTTGALSYGAALDGSSSNERGLAIDRDNAKAIYITGYTSCSYTSIPCSTSTGTTPGIATTGAYDTTFNGPSASQDAFVAKYTDSGSAFTLNYATYLGGQANDVGYGITVDSFGNAYVAGETFSPDFPLVSPDDATLVKGEAFLARLNQDGKELTYSSFWGGAENDSGRGLAKDFSNDVYMVGYTNSPKDGFSLGTITPYRDYSGGADAFVTKFSIPTTTTDFNLSVKLQGSGSGAVTSTPQGIGKTAECKQTEGVLIPNANCDANYATGTKVTLTAVPATGSLFVGWSGSGSGTCAGSSALTCEVTMDGSKQVVAKFSPSQTLTVIKTGSGTVTSGDNPQTINCGTTCSANYVGSTQVTLTAQAAAGSTFTGWSGACTTIAGTCVVTMDAAKSVTATFISAPGDLPDLKIETLTTPSTGQNTGRNINYSLTVKNIGKVAAGSFKVGLYLLTSPRNDPSNFSPNGVGVISAGECLFDSLAVNTTTSCSRNLVLPNSLIAGSYYLGAYADPDNTIAESDEANNGKATTNTLPIVILTVNKSGNGQGVVTGTPFWINCGTQCTTNFLSSATTKVTLTAVSDPGSTFTGWSSAGCSGTASCEVTMDATKSVTATFSSQTSAVGVFREGTWFLDANGNGAWDGCQQDGGQDLCLFNSFGQAGDLPAAGNWDGGAKSSIGVLRSSSGQWFIDLNGNHQWDGCVADGCYDGFGQAGDLPVAGDWNGSGVAKIGVFRNGQWFLDANGNGSWDGCGTELCLSFGQTGDLPVAGNWNGGLQAGVGVFRAGTWYLDYNGNGKWDGCDIDRCYFSSFGQAGDLPVAGDWNGDGKAKVGVFRNGTWYLDYDGDGKWGGCQQDGGKDRCYIGSFGQPGDLPVAGRW
ncbi:SBBP repeat-containing protein [Candidatus Contendibacter odensensis]|uniref:Uncharacterized protein n=1 Tax=Candidatus Contendobacter odensis Run_B_J11 TaxID=1400861 RepID=A0A7U7J648_9GAMM|nr:SBBP repeat-containing protein [Candidatus Contendobacter odensis]CDH47363.1 exported hypothetical protein [Candidatus Contendobacter odensis Run_B_J11]